jgi:hypothetical protein
MVSSGLGPATSVTAGTTPVPTNCFGLLAITSAM